MLGEMLSLILGVIFFPITILLSWVVVAPQEHVILLRWGKFRRHLRHPGLYWFNIWGCRVIRVSTKHVAADLPRNVVADANANPILVSAVVTYRFVDTVKAALEVEDAHAFVKTQALAVLKQVASRYPYESSQGASLKSEADEIGQEMVRTLQQKVAVAGAQVLSFELSDLAYAPEIAPAMLIRQQAQALVGARRTIVEGAVEIVHDAMNLLLERGVVLPQPDRARLVSNLLTVICGEARVQPTFPIQSAEMEEEKTHRIVELLERIARNTERDNEE